MSNSLVNTIDVSQSEYTFPNLIPTLECNNMLWALYKKLKPHRIIFWVTFGMFIAFMILTGVLGCIAFSVEFQIGTWDETLGEYVHEKADYTGIIICAILCFISIIVGVVNLIRSLKYSKNISALKEAIKINSQYSAFINQGYEKKEAYKLTLEWIDRQSNIAALNSVASTNALIAMSNINHINHH